MSEHKQHGKKKKSKDVRVIVKAKPMRRTRRGQPKRAVHPKMSSMVSPALLSEAKNELQSGFKPGEAGGGGDYFGDLLGGLGNKLGNWLSGKAKGFIGMGDYDDATTHVDSSDIEANSLCAGSQAPLITNKGQAFIFRHREYVQDIGASSGFSNTPYLINPGNRSLFPWLAPLSSSFEEYQILGMIVEYKPLISANNTNAQGSVVLSTEYNSTKAIFTSKTQAENAEYATSCAPHHAMFHAIECKPSETTVGHKNVLVGAVPTGQDGRIYNWGQLQVIVQGQVSAATLGELWITYEIACFKPLFSSGLGLSIYTDKFSGALTITASTNPFNGHTAAQFLTDRQSGSLLGITCATNGIFSFPINITTGVYMFEFAFNNTVAWSAGVNIGVPTVANGALLSVFAGDSSNFQSSYSTTGGGSTLFYRFWVSVAAPGSAVCQITPGALSGVITNTVTYDLIVTQVNGSITT